eukprot:TCONS_00070437-protein
MEELFGELESVSDSISNWSGLIDDDNKVKDFISKVCQLIDFIQEEEKPTEKLKFLFSSCESLERCFGLISADQSWTVEIVCQCLAFFLFIFKFFEDCKNNSAVNSIAEDLAKLFQTAYKHLKFVSVKLEHISETQWNKDRIQLNQAYKLLVECSLVLRHLDIMACVPIWRQMKKIILRQPCTEIDDDNSFIVPSFFDSFILSIHAVEQWIDSFIQGDMEMARRSEKVSKFMMSLNLQILIVYKEKAGRDDCKKVLNLLIKLKSSDIQLKQIPSNVDGTKVVEYFTAIIKPMMTEFIQMSDAPSSFNGFLEDITSGDSGNTTLSITPEILSVLASCENTHTIITWMDPDSQNHDHSILKMIMGKLLHEFEHSILFRGNALYEDLLVNMCFFVAMLSGEYFNHLEETLLDNLLENESSLAALFVSDLWCFVNRWGSEELCWQHFQYLGRLLLQYDSSSHVLQHTRISALLKRIFLFLPFSMHSKIATVFRTSKETIPIWSVICPWNFDEEGLQKEVATQICQSFLDVMTSGDDENFNDHEFADVTNCMVNLTSSIENFNTHIEDEMKEKILEPVVDYWHCFEHAQEDIDMNEQLLVGMLHLIMNLFSYLDQQTFLQMISCISKVVISIDSEAVQLQCCSTLAMLKNVNFPTQIKENCLQKLSLMFKHLITSSSWIVQTYAMKALKDYAEVTSYPKVLGTFLPTKMKKDFAKFLKKKTHLEELSMLQLQERTFELLSIEPSTNQKTHKENCITNNEKIPNGLTDSKRMKIDSTEYLKGINNHLDNIEQEVTLLQQLQRQQNFQLTNDTRQRILNIVQNLKSIPG